MTTKAQAHEEPYKPGLCFLLGVLAGVGCGAGLSVEAIGLAPSAWLVTAQGLVCAFILSSQGSKTVPCGHWDPTSRTLF